MSGLARIDGLPQSLGQPTQRRQHLPPSLKPTSFLLVGADETHYLLEVGPHLEIFPEKHALFDFFGLFLVLETLDLFHAVSPQLIQSQLQPPLFLPVPRQLFLLRLRLQLLHFQTARVAAQKALPQKLDYRLLFGRVPSLQKVHRVAHILPRFLPPQFHRYGLLEGRGEGEDQPLHALQESDGDHGSQKEHLQSLGFLEEVGDLYAALFFGFAGDH